MCIFIYFELSTYLYFSRSNFEFHRELHDRNGRDHGYEARVVPGGRIGPPHLGVVQLVLGGDSDVGGAGELRGLRVYIEENQDMEIQKICLIPMHRVIIGPPLQEPFPWHCLKDGPFNLNPFLQANAH